MTGTTLTRKAATRQALAVLTEKWPAVFIRHPRKPLRLGVYDEVYAGVDGIITLRAARDAMRLWCSTLSYRRAVAAGGPRYDLLGNVDGEIIASEQAEAAARVLRMEAEREKLVIKREADRAAYKAAQREAQQAAKKAAKADKADTPARAKSQSRQVPVVINKPRQSSRPILSLKVAPRLGVMR